jgi:hypothetical protein
VADKGDDELWKLALTIAAAVAVMAAAIAVSPLVLIIGVIWLAYKLHQTYQNSPARLAKVQRSQMLDLVAHPPPVPFPDEDTFVSNVLREHQAAKHKDGYPAFPVLLILDDIIAAVYSAEGLNRLPTPPASMEGLDAARYRDEIADRLRKTADIPKTLALLQNTILECLTEVEKELPRAAKQSRETLALYANGTPPTVAMSVPLMDLAHPGKMVEALALPFFGADVIQLRLFDGVRKQLRANQEEMSGKSGLVMPSEHPGTPQDIVYGYLKDTPFLDLFDVEIPFSISIEDRLEHTAIVAGSGHGKTQLLQSIIAQDLELDDPPGYIIVDSTGAMVREIQRLGVFNGKLKDRLLVIDPERDPVPALNMFDIATPRFQNYSPAMRESIESEVIDLFNYVFSSIGNELTAQQATPFAFMVRLLLALPGSNLQTMRELLEDKPRGGYDHALPKFKAAIETLDPATQSFFKTQYYTQGSDSRREQIAQRIYAVIKVPAFERMFSTVNKVDMFAEMNRGAIIVVNSNENFLRDASALFGRYIVARVMAAAFERASIPAKDRRPVFLVVDEAAPYFDDTFEKLLTRVRQFKLGVVIAFQHLEQASGKLRSAIASSTAIKYAGGLGYADTQWLAREMRVDPEFIIEQKRHAARPPQWTKFACYVRNYTDHAISLTIPFFTLENSPKMTDAEHAELMKRNAARVSAAPTLAPSISEQALAKVSPPSLIDEVMAAVPRKSPPKTDAGEPSKEGW